MNIDKIKNNLKKFKKGIVKGAAGALTIITIMTLPGCGEKEESKIDDILVGEPIKQECLDEYNKSKEKEINYNNKFENAIVIDKIYDEDEIIESEELENFNIPQNEIDDEINNLKELLSYKFDDDEEIAEEEKDDRASLYIQILEAINDNNSLADYDMEYYMSQNYKTLLYEGDFFSKERLEYAALAYKKIQDNGINIMDVLDELENVVIYQINPIETGINELFPLLSSTLVDDENIYDIYFTLACQLHQCTCDNEHTIDPLTGTFECDDLIKKINTKEVKNNIKIM